MLLGEMCRVETNFGEADFWIQDNGMSIRVYNPRYIGVKVNRTDILVPDYLYYVIQYLHQQGYFRGAPVTVEKVKSIAFR